MTAAETTTDRRGAGIECEGLVRIYASEDTEVVALQGLDLTVEPGEMVTVMGASGSGKSTMLNILAGLDRPTAGRVFVDDHDLLGMGERERTEYRRHVIGFVWQQTARNLLPYLTAIDNVLLPLTVAGAGRSTRSARADHLLDLVGMSARRLHRPAALSGGEQQRVAIAVALANQPRLLLADEPTGELDVDTAGDVIEVLQQACRDEGATTIIVTHDEAIARSGSRSITIRDGRVSSERKVNRWAGGIFEEERVVLDRAGRLQLPDDQVRAIGLERLVRVDRDDDHLIIERDDQ